MRAAGLVPILLCFGLAACSTSANSPNSSSSAPPATAATVSAVSTSAPTAAAAATTSATRSTATPATTAVVPSPAPPAQAVASGSATVTLSQPPDDAHSWQFEPATVTVKVGGTVTWTNPQGNEIHTVTADDGQSFDSNVISAGETFQHVFPAAGTFAYHCTLHNWMKGVVVVVP